MLTFKEAMAIFKVSQATLYRWIREDGIKSKEYWGQKMYDLDTLQESFDKRRNQ
jgi:predicted site-specific integrase-resolvase